MQTKPNIYIITYYHHKRHNNRNMFKKQITWSCEFMIFRWPRTTANKTSKDYRSEREVKTKAKCKTHVVVYYDLNIYLCDYINL